MTEELIQTNSVVDMIIARRNCSEGYARRMVHIAVHSGKLKPYKRKLKYGTRAINLFKPSDVNMWLDQAKQNNKMPIDRV